MNEITSVLFVVEEYTDNKHWAEYTGICLSLSLKKV